jgi:selenide,water dikinase
MQRINPDATFRNWNSYSKEVGFEKGVDVMQAFQVLPDPQTNGGLLICIAPDAVPKLEELFRNHSLQDHLQPIGKITDLQEKRITVLDA